MKKYVKPELFYERFELSQHIADCAWELTQADEKTCSADPDPEFGSGALSSLVGATLFTIEGICDLVPKVNYHGAYCYHTGTSDDFPKVFSS